MPGRNGIVAALEEIKSLFSSSRRQLLTRGAADDKEVPDPTPVELPVGYEAPTSTEQLIQQYVRVEMSRLAAGQELETFEQADDFEAEDPEELQMSGFEVHYHELEEEMPAADASPPGSRAEPPEPAVPALAAPAAPATPPATPAPAAASAAAVDEPGPSQASF